MREVERIVRAGIADGIVKGEAVLAGTPSKTLYRGEFGFAENTLSNPMRTDTVIDCASVTKAVATVTALLICHARGLIDFDAPFTEYLKDYTPALDHEISIRHLANHTSGFVDPEGGARLYFDESGLKMLKNVLTLPPTRGIQEEAHYSCWNYLLLGLILERITGRRFPEFCGTEIFLPLGMNDSSVGKPLDSIPETRLAQTLGTAKPGEISDFVAFRIYRDGGSAGNAGLFSSCADLAKLLRCYLRHGETQSGGRLFGEREFAWIAPRPARRTDGYREFGWVIYDSNMCESEFGSSLVHSGWSGQTLFLNFKKDFFAAVLTVRGENYGRAKADRFAVIRELYENA